MQGYLEGIETASVWAAGPSRGATW